MADKPSIYYKKEKLFSQKQFAKYCADRFIFPSPSLISDIRLLWKSGVIGNASDVGKRPKFTEFYFYKYQITYSLKNMFSCQSIDSPFLVAVLSNFSKTRFLICKRLGYAFWEGFQDNLTLLPTSLESQITKLLLERTWKYPYNKNRFCSFRWIPRYMNADSFQDQVKKIFLIPDINSLSVKKFQEINEEYGIASRQKESKQTFIKNDLYKLWVLLLLKYLFDCEGYTSGWLQELYFAFGRNLSRLPLCCAIVHLPESELRDFKLKVFSKSVLQMVIK